MLSRSSGKQKFADTEYSLTILSLSAISNDINSKKPWYLNYNDEPITESFLVHLRCNLRKYYEVNSFVWCCESFFLPKTS